MEENMSLETTNWFVNTISRSATKARPKVSSFIWENHDSNLISTIWPRTYCSWDTLKYATAISWNPPKPHLKLPWNLLEHSWDPMKRPRTLSNPQKTLWDLLKRFWDLFVSPVTLYETPWNPLEAPGTLLGPLEALKVGSWTVELIY